MHTLWYNIGKQMQLAGHVVINICAQGYFPSFTPKKLFTSLRPIYNAPTLIYIHILYTCMGTHLHSLNTVKGKSLFIYLAFNIWLRVTKYCFARPLLRETTRTFHTPVGLPCHISCPSSSCFIHLFRELRHTKHLFCSGLVKVI